MKTKKTHHHDNIAISNLNKYLQFQKNHRQRLSEAEFNDKPAGARGFAAQKTTSACRLVVKLTDKGIHEKWRLISEPPFQKI